MKLTHQVFLQLPEGSRMWMASASSLKEATEYVRNFDSISPGTYLIVDVPSRQVVEPWVDPGAGMPAWQRSLLASFRRVRDAARSFEARPHPLEPFRPTQQH
jgi:hypothetical protein